MSYTYAQKRQAAARTARTETQGRAADSAVPNSVRLAALEAGKASPTAAEMGRRVDLPEAMRGRMEASFGADLSAVRLYESQTVGDAGAEAITQGNRIAFAPGKLDLSSRSGQELLGHELSHVVSQQRGEVTGGGFLNDSALEARADREGAMAAAGEQIYGGAVAPLSGSSAAPAAGPMQAKRESAEEKTANRMMAIQAGKSNWKNDVSDEDDQWYNEQLEKGDLKVAKALMNGMIGDTKEMRKVKKRNADTAGIDTSDYWAGTSEANARRLARNEALKQMNLSEDDRTALMSNKKNAKYMAEANQMDANAKNLNPILNYKWGYKWDLENNRNLIYDNHLRKKRKNEE